jgi:arsenite methyltransferase
MSHTPDESIRDAVTTRYDGLAGSCCSLSCGHALDDAAVRPGEVVLDLGCGRGEDVIRAAGRVGPAGRAIGVDLAEAMLAEARRRVPPFLTNVQFLRGSLERIDLPTASVDVVISNCVINHAPDKTAVYREIRRLLSPTGRFVVSDVVAEEEVPEAVRADPAAWAGCYGGAIPLPDYRRAVAEAGLVLDDVSASDPYEKGGIMVRSATFRGRVPG